MPNTPAAPAALRRNPGAPASVAVLGAGLMGHGIAQVFAAAGSEVRIWDPDGDTLASVHRRIDANLEKIAGWQHAPTSQASTGDRVSLSGSLEAAVSGVEVIFEASPENLGLKRNVVAQIDRCNPEAVLATNTSVLRIGDIAAGSPHSVRVVGAHWWNPPYLIPVVEVVPSEHTSDAVTDAVIAWLEGAGKLPVTVRKDVPGFIGNRLQFALWREALNLVEEGVCDAGSVDLVARNTFGLRLAAMGPIENADFIGLDLVRAIMDYVLPSLSAASSPPEILTTAVDGGRLGAKAGQGLLDWEQGDRERAHTRLLHGILNALGGERLP
ncbi:3-hydroxyacyl-CoA dehydrogenase family protein [Sinomonas sp. JGH33]|uniref:3-hydroxyacyl-CoA dehydrogenase family protein n=1 Tax=Sinomonas terricola TaxID=3110330 RepID=A0ABU5TCC7_9MICC|nr:3-hydroxyacyl-CoA dehydrogenase family protein [Sinomonas sp. JGH33]MEA5457268.1 3-hydroxyacyl-CoA dehydrogenase family protein [Sinomonas sp. JGH33]